MNATKISTKVNLKNAAEVFGLWDNVYGKDAIRYMETSQTWDPARKERERREKQKTAKKVNPAFQLKS
jgi:hypothetical protein